MTSFLNVEMSLFFFVLVFLELKPKFVYFLYFKLVFLSAEVPTSLSPSHCPFLFLYKCSFMRVFLLIQIFALVNKSELSLTWMAYTTEITYSIV